jgi:GTPase SAR1 family protein
LKSLIATGVTYDGENRGINQIVRYHQALAETRSGLSKYTTRGTATTDQQVKDITRDICQKVELPNDEIFLYGFGRGAYIARAVATTLHHMGLPKSNTDFDAAYTIALDLVKARLNDDSLNGTKLLSQISAICDEPPVIRFMGVFDTIKPSLDKHQYDMSFVKSIRNLRHAVAFNESRIPSEVFETPAPTEIDNRSYIQAWFIGAHQDMGGGTQHDGLSLYALQWMLTESMKNGLVLASGRKDSGLELAFPQFAGQLPQLDGQERIEWRLRMANDIRVTMFDLATLHIDTKSESTHTIRINQGGSGITHQRKIWGSKSVLRGWNKDAPYGTIIHPSLYTILDRNPKMYDTGLFKIRKNELSDYQERCIDDQGALQPWLEGLHLQASGVKAFRILVCGKTGVGKSTLINKVFGVEMTEESTTYAQGQHDINTAFESPNHPGLLVHDSRGWQAGSDTELDLIAKFLRHRAFQKDPAESLHVIWFCVDSDVSRIEEADKRTFATIAQFSNHVPVFVVGTKKDKLIAYRKMELLEQYMKQTNDYKEASKLATAEANKLADEQFGKLKDQLSEIEHYKADGYCCISKGKSQSSSTRRS